MFARKFKLDLNKTTKAVGGKGKREKVGEAMVPCPILSDFGITAAQAKDDKGQLLEENGLPVYAEATFQWLQDAIQSAVAVKVRNKFSLDGKLKPGHTIPVDFEALTEESSRTGEAMAIRKEARVSFETYLRSRNMKDAAVAALGDLFQNSSKILASVTDKHLEALARFSGEWVAQLEDASKTRFAPKLQELMDSINNARSEDEEEDMFAVEEAA